ncbi:MAG: hypothetical protein PUA57_01515 [Eggerthellales bacterium]|nr:hypothetical protein [Eggerthellales bacterium]
MKAISCNNCGSKELTKIGDYYYCDYCGSKYIQESGEQRSQDVSAILSNAKNAYKTKAFDACQISCGKVLDANPNHPVAIYLRGACVYRLDGRKVGAERSSWRTACSIAEDDYRGTSVPLDLAITAFPIAINIITEKRDRAVLRNSAIVEKLEEQKKAAEEREKRLKTDRLFKVASDLKGFIDEVSGDERHVHASSRELASQIEEMRDEFIAIEACFVDDASDVLVDTWNLVCEDAAPISLLKAMRKTAETLRESIKAIRVYENNSEIEKKVDASADAVNQVSDLLNEAVIEAVEKICPGTMAEYRCYLTSLKEQKSRLDDEIASLERELAGTKLLEVKKQFSLRSKLMTLKGRSIGPEDPCAVFADQALAKLG